MEYIILVIALAAIGGLIYYRVFYKKAQKIKQPSEIAIKAKNLTVTPKGAKIRAERDEMPSPAILEWIDEGISINIARVERLKPNYQHKLKHSDFIVCLLDAEPSASGKPAFKVPISKNDPYYRSEYRKGTDENPYVLAAGQMISVGEPYGNIIAVPKPITNDREHLQTGVDYECEHIQAAWNDPDLFEATKTHIGSGHPIYTDATGLIARTSDFKCGGAQK